MSRPSKRAIPTATRRRSLPFWVAVGCVAFMAFWTTGCISPALRPPPSTRCITVPMDLTGYCNCGKCCNWKDTWLGLGSPVIASGPHRGDPKKVGYTSSGTEARRGTIAADIGRYPYGTIVEIPGYGTGRVEDTGGAIHGDHFDLWFSNHDQALHWGKQRKLVKIWLPSDRRRAQNEPLFISR